MRTNHVSFYTAIMLVIALIMTGCAKPTESPTSSAGTVSPAKPETRIVEHLFGKTEIPTNAKRIVSINLEDMLLSLQVPLVLATSVGEGYYLEERLNANNVPVMIWGDAIHYETVLKANPDLIVATDAIDQATYDQLAKIAPTVVYDRRDWRTSIEKIGKDLGLEAKAEEVTKQFAERLAQAKEKIVQAVGSEATVEFLRTTAKDIRLYFPSVLSKPAHGYARIIYNDLGLKPDPLVVNLQKQNPDRENASVTLEMLPQLQADYLFVTSGSAAGTRADLEQDLATFEEIKKMSLWQSLPAVKNGHVFLVGAKHWISDGPIADELKMNDVVEALTKK